MHRVGADSVRGGRALRQILGKTTHRFIAHGLLPDVCYPAACTMRTVTKKHSSVADGKTRFAQVTVAALTTDEQAKRPAIPELFLNDFRVNRLTKKDEDLVYSAVRAVQLAEQQLGWRGPPLCVTRVESSFVDRDPEAAQIAATKAATALING
jgi:hypothetical protein